MEYCRFLHRITKARCATRPDEKGGGVLADEMGMGKTLSMLALVINTLEEGQEWAARSNSEDLTQCDIRNYAHSTLIIVPSACKDVISPVKIGDTMLT